jgi:G3E family GTPase
MVVEASAVAANLPQIMRFSRDDLVKAALDLATASAAVSNYCDHVEHNERTEIEDVREAGAVLRDTAVRLSSIGGFDPVELYARRLAVIEARHVLHTEDSFDGEAAAREIGDWRGLQLVQAAHDRAYHADVIGLTKCDQLRHYALHVAKLAGATAQVSRGELDRADWLQRRVPDMLLFGLKLATVTSEALPVEEVEACLAPGPSHRVAA